MVHRPIRMLLCVLAAASLAGCQGNKKPQPAPVPEGPVTSLETPEGVTLREIPAGAGEMDLVERVVYYRSMYARSLRALRDHYRAQGNATRLTWAEEELRQVWQLKPYSYVMDAEVPAAPGKPEASIEQADDLFNEGVSLLDKATEKGSKYDKATLQQALAKFKELVRKYPTSDKADKACYYIGMIHDQYFPDDAQIAIAWYKQAWTMNPELKMPARFNAARIYDERLRDRDMALTMYRQVLEHEKFHKENYDHATRRMIVLTTKGEGAAERALAPAYKQ